MKSLLIPASAVLILALASCANNKHDSYDTANPYGMADSGVNAPVAGANPVYDTPAAYEQTGAAAVTSPQINAVPPVPTGPAGQSAPAYNPRGPATIHTVVRGDTLSGIAAKYKVPAAAIKQANNMTSDVVVLDRKMVIPNVH